MKNLLLSQDSFLDKPSNISPNASLDDFKFSVKSGSMIKPQQKVMPIKKTTPVRSPIKEQGVFSEDENQEEDDIGDEQINHPASNKKSNKPAIHVPRLNLQQVQILDFQSGVITHEDAGPSVIK